MKWWMRLWLKLNLIHTRWLSRNNMTMSEVGEGEDHKRGNLSHTHTHTHTPQGHVWIRFQTCSACEAKSTTQCDLIPPPPRQRWRRAISSRIASSLSICLFLHTPIYWAGHPHPLLYLTFPPPWSFIRLKRAGSIKASVSPYRKHFVERGFSLRNKGARSRLLRETLRLFCFFGIILTTILTVNSFSI